MLQAGHDIPGLVTALGRHEGSVERFLEAFAASEARSPDMLAAFNLIAMSAAYSPSPDRKGIPFDLLCDPRTGEIDSDVWRRWLVHDPVEMVARHAEALRSLRLLYLDAGTRDEYHLELGARILCRRLDSHGVRYVHEEFDDGHRGIAYRYDRSLPLVTAAISIQ